MKINTRNSALKGRTRHSFRRRMKTRSGRTIINRQRRLACGRPKKR